MWGSRTDHSMGGETAFPPWVGQCGEIRNEYLASALVLDTELLKPL
jgi:hypothetical protein